MLLPTLLLSDLEHCLSDRDAVITLRRTQLIEYILPEALILCHIALRQLADVIL